MAKVEFHPDELFPTVGFIVTNRSLPNERVLAFYNGRGTAEQHLLAHADMRCQATHQGEQARAEVDAPFVHALRGQRGAAPTPCAGLQPRQLSAHARDTRYAVFQLAEAALPRAVFSGVLDLINALRGPPAEAAPA